MNRFAAAGAAGAACLALAFAPAATAAKGGKGVAKRAQHDTTAAAMVDSSKFNVDPFFTVGETLKGYSPIGILDGIGAFAGGRGNGAFTLTVNHEPGDKLGYPYTLANGTTLTGARISRFEIQSKTLKTIDADLAYDTIIGYDGTPITSASEINPLAPERMGLSRLCSARGVSAGEYGFVDDIHFAGEEEDNGILVALDVKNETLYTVPDAGFLAWENVSPVPTGDPNKTALLVGDDREGAPLWLYVGEKQAGGDFLERNGLVGGTLYAWVADANSATNEFNSPAEFYGNGTRAAGHWVAIDTKNADGSYRTTEELDTAALEAGAFEFSRPEDVNENPENPTQLVMSSTGRDKWDGKSDVYGTTYLIDVTFEDGVPADTDLTILYDGDVAYAKYGADNMLRSPDNLTWASDGMIYVNEDRAIGGDWGTIEASIWKLNPNKFGWAERQAVIDRSAVPAGQVDTKAGELGAWETSGILDISEFVKGDEMVLVSTVQAHGVKGGVIDALNLIEGGQLYFLKKA